MIFPLFFGKSYGILTFASGSRWVLVCPLVFKTSEGGEELPRWVRFPHVPAMCRSRARAAAVFFCPKKARKPSLSGKETVFSEDWGLYKQKKIRYNITGLVGLPPNDRKYEYQLEETSGKSALRGGTDGINQRPPAAGEHLR